MSDISGQNSANSESNNEHVSSNTQQTVSENQMGGVATNSTQSHPILKPTSLDTPVSVIAGKHSDNEARSSGLNPAAPIFVAPIGQQNVIQPNPNNIVDNLCHEMNVNTNDRSTNVNRNVVDTKKDGVRSAASSADTTGNGDDGTVKENINIFVDQSPVRVEEFPKYSDHTALCWVMWRYVYCMCVSTHRGPIR